MNKKIIYLTTVLIDKFNIGLLLFFIENHQIAKFSVIIYLITSNELDHFTKTIHETSIFFL